MAARLADRGKNWVAVELINGVWRPVAVEVPRVQS